MWTVVHKENGYDKVPAITLVVLSIITKSKVKHLYEYNNLARSTYIVCIVILFQVSVEHGKLPMA